MTKRTFLLLLALLTTLLPLCALNETHTIVLVAVVTESKPQFALRSSSGEVGQSLSYKTDQIKYSDVHATFDIVQINNSNSKSNVHFCITATELVGISEGTEYHTNGVEIIVNGQAHRGSACIEKHVEGFRSCGTKLESFEVIWQKDEKLANTDYQAVVTLSYSAC